MSAAPIRNRPAPATRRARQVLQAHWATIAEEINADLGLEEAFYRIPLLSTEKFKVRAQDEVGKLATTQVRVVPSLSVQQAKSVGGQAINEWALEVALVVQAEDFQIPESADLEEEVVLAGLEMAEVAQRCLTRTAAQEREAAQEEEREVRPVLVGYAGVGAPQSLTVEHTLQKKIRKDKTVIITGVAVLLTIVFAQTKRL